tara:strand:- start:147 stop:2843 length:2697 start_codon:yes stop_codon:yes gene_type:complete
VSSIELELFDTSLRSSSAEPLRKITSNYYIYGLTDSGAKFTYATDTSLEGSYVSAIKTNFDLVEETVDSAMLNSYKFPVRVSGDMSKIDDDAVWSKIVYGGTYADNYYEALYAEGIYSDNVCSFDIPYANLQANVLYSINNTSYDAIKIKPAYNYSLAQYEAKAFTTSERFLPNVYFFQQISDAESADTVDDEVLNTVYNSVTFNDRFAEYMNFDLSQVSELLSPTEMSEINGTLPPEESLYYGNNDLDSSLTSDTFYDRNYNLRNYMSASYVGLAPYVNASDVIDFANLSAISENYIFDDLSVQKFIYSDADVFSTAELFPYYINIEIPVYEQDTTFRDLVGANQAVQPLMAALARAFGIGGSGVVPDTFTAITNRSYYLGDVGGSSVEYKEETISSNIVSYDFLEFLLDEQDRSRFSTLSFIGAQNSDRKASSGQLYEAGQFIDKDKILNLILSFTDYVNTTGKFDLEQDDATQVFQNMLKLANEKKQLETIAYQVEKRNANNQIVSSFWVYNELGLDIINLVDTQIKLKSNYTYSVYEYKLVHGFKYTYSDIVKSNIIYSETDADGENTGLHILEFKNNSDTASEQLFEAEEDNAYLAANPFATNAQIQVDETIGDSKYLIDFNVSFTPDLTMLRIPVFQKTLSVFDHPATTINVVPYHMLGGSQKIGFKLYKEAAHKREVPYSFNQIFGNNILAYKNAYDLVDSDYITDKAKTKVTQIGVYRIEQRPTSYDSFKNSLYKTVSMTKEDNSTISQAICESVVETNKKYYYTFQCLSEGGMPGSYTEIYESELIDDGGYVYAVFKVINQSDLDEGIYNKTSVDFKKIFQLLPNSSHTQLITEDADFAANSYTQLENVNIGNTDLEDPIWGKTFKLRLTSKKTGKKIDLNITYNLENG